MVSYIRPCCFNCFTLSGFWPSVLFLVARKQLFKSVSVRPWVRPSASNAFTFWPSRGGVCRVYGFVSSLPTWSDLEPFSSVWSPYITFLPNSLVVMVVAVVVVPRAAAVIKIINRYFPHGDSCVYWCRWRWERQRLFESFEGFEGFGEGLMGLRGRKGSLVDSLSIPGRIWDVTKNLICIL